jgi:hypothetical protein
MSGAEKTRSTDSDNSSWRAAMALLDIEKIVVVDEQDWEPGGDELYFTVNGEKVGPSPSLSTGESHIFPYDPIYFSGTATVHLYEEDGWFNNDDYIASATFSTTPGQDMVKWMDGDGGMYDVYFNVIA